MPAHRTVVGTDGSSTSSTAVDRAATVAADNAAELAIVRAYSTASREQAAADALRTPADETFRAAEDRATAAGAPEVRTSAAEDQPVGVPYGAVAEHAADLLVVGNKGRGPLSGRLLDSVPPEAARRSGVDVLIAPTT